jgi:IS5 family transposase
MKHTPPPQPEGLQDSYLVRLLVPPDHRLVRLKEQVDFTFVREWVEPQYDPARGRPALDPARLLALCFLQSLYGLSDREVIARTQTDLALRWFAGFSVEEALPHPTMLTKFRQRLGEAGFREAFQRSVRRAVAAGLVSQRLLLVDSAGIVADVAIPRLRQLLRRVTLKALRGLLALDPAGGELLEEWAALRGDNCWWQTQELREKNLGEWWALAERVRERLAQARGASAEQEGQRQELVEMLAAAVRRQGPRRAGRGRDGLVSEVDPEARWSGKGRGQLYAGYKEQLAVDADSEIITAVEVRPANVDDSELLVEVVQGHEQATGSKPEAVTADSKYHSGENRQELARREIEDFVAVPTAKGHKRGEFSASDFGVEYNARSEPWRVTCPGGQTAVGGRTKRNRSGWTFYFSRGQCAGCALREKCTQQRRGRTVQIGEHFRENQAARERAAREGFQRKQVERLGIERHFAQRRRRSGLGRARYRGREKVAIQALLASLVSNVLKLAGVAGAGTRQPRLTTAKGRCITMVAESCTG